jgi:UDPglucose--hexose-1-phosphate uridylyltransferase
MADLRERPHRRFNPLTREWVLVSPHRTERPWQGQVERTSEARLPRYDPDCYLCPGNSRAGGARNPSYAGTFAFTNDFAALLADTAEANYDGGELFRAIGESGICRVVCFSPRHDLTLGRMNTPEIRRVVDTWADQCVELAAMPQIGYIQIFENRGEIMGCSNPHPHCQIWASHSLPNEVEKEQRSQEEYFGRTGRCLLADYVEQEQARAERSVCENASFVALIPFWAVWPFETIVVARNPVSSVASLTPAERDDLADMLRRMTARYDNLFQVSFPYSMGFHQAPADGHAHPEWRLHAHFYPPLLRSATVKKFMVGYELLAMPQRDITAERAAERLRALPESPLEP